MADFVDLKFEPESKRLIWVLKQNFGRPGRSAELRAELERFRQSEAVFYDAVGKKISAQGLNFSSGYKGHEAFLLVELNLNGIAERLGSKLKDIATVKIEQPGAKSDDGKVPERTAGEGVIDKRKAKERLDLLKKIAAEAEKAFDGFGAFPYSGVLEAKMQVHKAELDLADSDKERVAIHEKIVALAKELENYADKAFKQGDFSSGDLIKAKTGRLEAEIALEKAKAQAGNKVK
jgi:hypothetical protein